MTSTTRYKPTQNLVGVTNEINHNFHVPAIDLFTFLLLFNKKHIHNLKLRKKERRVDDQYSRSYRVIMTFEPYHVMHLFSLCYHWNIVNCVFRIISILSCL